MNASPIGEKIILPNGKPAPLSQAYRVDNLLFMSGQLPFLEDGSLSTGSIEEQTAICLEGLEKTLEKEGLTKNNMVKLTIWLTHVEDFAGFNSAYVEFFGDHLPARSTVRSDLMLPGARIEIEAIAAY